MSIQTLLRQTRNSHAYSLPSGRNIQHFLKNCCMDECNLPVGVHVKSFLSVSLFVTGLFLSRRHFYSGIVSSRNLQFTLGSQ